MQQRFVGKDGVLPRMRRPRVAALDRVDDSAGKGDEYCDEKEAL